LLLIFPPKFIFSAGITVEGTKISPKKNKLMKIQKYFTIPILTLLILLTTTNQQISSSPDVLYEVKEPVPSQTEIELGEMKDVINDYEQWLTQEIQKSGTVGAAIAIIYKDQIAFLKCFGNREVGKDAPVDEHTVFRLASVSKPITGVFAGLLAQDEVLDFDEKVNEILPWFRLGNNSYTRQLTIRNLLSHTSGLVPHAYDDLVETHASFTNILSRMKDAGVASSPGTVYSYQNVMFSLIDTILSVKTSKNYGQLIKEKLFEPLGMDDASTDFESFKNNPNKAIPHRGANGVYRKLPLNNRYYITAPAAGVNASITDMSNFLIALLDEENPLLDENIFGKIFEPQVVSNLSSGYFRYWDQVQTKKYALGWRMVDYKGRNIAYHGGYVNGYKAEIAISKQDNIGIVYLTNSPNTVASQSIPVFLNSLIRYKDNLPVMADLNDREDKKTIQDI
jgi:beta-lactamase class C